MLLDERGERFSLMKDVVAGNGNKLTLAMTGKGTEHFDALTRISTYISNKNWGKVKEEYLKYFFPNMQLQQIQKKTVSFSDAELLKYLKNLLSPPYQYGINLLEKHFRKI